jgi:hypothetical protein
MQTVGSQEDIVIILKSGGAVVWVARSRWDSHDSALPQHTPLALLPELL